VAGLFILLFVKKQNDIEELLINFCFDIILKKLNLENYKGANFEKQENRHRRQSKPNPKTQKLDQDQTGN
jgi:hypothetical protein